MLEWLWNWAVEEAGRTWKRVLKSLEETARRILIAFENTID